MVETKQARIERLRALRRKFGLGEFKKSYSVKRRLVKVAKKARRRTASRGLFGSPLVNTALGVGGYILFETLLEPKVAQFVGNGLVLNLVELAAGAYIANRGGVLGSIGKAAIVINVYQILQPLLGSATVQNAIPLFN